MLHDLDEENTVGVLDLGKTFLRGTDLDLNSVTKVVVQPVDDVETRELCRLMLIADSPKDIPLPTTDVQPLKPRARSCGTDRCGVDVI